METKIAKPSKDVYNLAGQLIRKGEVVAFPTETVYGLGADATNAEAVKKIYTAKGRPSDNPLIVHLADKKDIKKYVLGISPLEQKIVDNFMPGAISLVLKKNDVIAPIVVAGGETVAIRIPENEVAREFIAATGRPICAPSANTSKRPSPTIAEHVFEDMHGKIPLIIDGGQTTVGIESTVVKVVDEEIYILRPGKFGKADFESKLHCVCHEKVLAGKVVESPGTKYTHYKPNCDMVLVKTNPQKTIVELYKKATSEGKKVVILCKEESLIHFKGLNAHALGKTSNDASHNVFKMLREFENNDLIIAEYFDNGTMVEGLFNRMIKSASGNLI